MCSYKITIKDIETFISDCSASSNDNYEPYFDDENEPNISLPETSPAILHNTGIDLLIDTDALSLYLFEHTHGLIGCCSTFSYCQYDGDAIYEISVLISPEYRRHGLGRMLVSQVLSLIEKNAAVSGAIQASSDANRQNTDNNNILLVGSNESFAECCGFSYSHSEHFMTRKPYAELSDRRVNKVSANNLTKNAEPGNDKPEYRIIRNLDRSSGFHTYRLLSRSTRISRCSIVECSDYINIANVYTAPKYRGHRFAGRLIDTVGADFPQKKLLLQVSGSNTAAIHAYTEAGFTFLKSIDYYSVNR